MSTSHRTTSPDRPSRKRAALRALAIAASIALTAAAPADAHFWWWFAPPAPDGPCPEDGAVAYPDFADPTGLMLNGAAHVDGDVLMLTPPRPWKRGSAFVREPFALDERGSFSASFTFRMGGEERGEGLAFVLQTRSPRALGAGDGGLGVFGLFPAVSVELDTGRDRFDPNRNHVGVNVLGLVHSVRTAKPDFDLADGAPHGAWIDYDADARTLQVRVSEDPAVRPERPLLSVAGLRLPARFGDRLYPGFTAATGRRSAGAHAIESWSFEMTYTCPCADDAACDDGVFCNGAETCVEGDCLAGASPCGDLPCLEEELTCELDLPKLETGSLLVGDLGATVELTREFTDPVVVASVHLANNAVPVVARVSRVQATMFDVRVVNPSGAPVQPERVSWIAVEKGAWEHDGVRYEAQTVESDVTDFKDVWTGQALAYLQSYAQPVVIGQVMTENDPRWSAFWCRGDTLGDAPSAETLVVGKHVAEDPDTERAPETLGVIVFEAGHGTLGGVEFEAGLGPDMVEGVDNAAPYAYDFVAPFVARAPSVTLVTAAGVDGLGGGWAVLWGDPAAEVDRLFLAMDEDQLADDERRHATEAVGYVVFAP